MSAAQALAAGETMRLAAGGSGWQVASGAVELYLIGPQRRRLVSVLEPGGQIAPQSDGPFAFAVVALVDARLEALPEGLFAAGDDPGARLDAGFAGEAAQRDAALVERLGAAQAADGAQLTGLALVAALVRLGGALGQPVDPARLRGSRLDFAHSPVLARIAGLRAARTVLPPQWWRGDAGPMLVEQGEERTPVGAVWRGGAYCDGAGQPLDPAQVHPLCWRFYAPLQGDLTTFPGMARSVYGGIRRELPFIAGSALGSALLGLALPLATGWVFDEIVPGGAGGLLIGMALVLVVAALVGAGFAATRALALSRVAGRGQVAMAAAVADRVLRLPTRFFKTMSPGDLEQRIAALERIRALVMAVLLNAGLTAFLALFYLILLFVYQPRMALAALAVTLVHGVAVAISRMAQAAPLREAAERDGKLAGLTFEMLEGLPKLRSAAAEPRMLERWQKAYALEREAVAKGQRISIDFNAFSDAWQIISLISLFATAALLATEKVPPGQFISFLATFAIFQASFAALADALLAIHAVRPLAERVRPVLSAPAEGAAGDGGTGAAPLRADPGTLRGDIAISGLTFAYDRAMAPLINELSLTVGAGEHLAIVGGSGSGKSTLLRLLLGFETPLTGSIAYDGQELASLDPARLRSQIGVVLQSSQMFAGTIMENIRGASDAGLDQCRIAAEAAGLAQDLAAMPMGLHTMITEGAGTLSGGQRQRILIARALAAAPRIVFLDEATSALDNATQALVAATLDRLDATRITIAHRLSTVRKADRICVLDRGRITESGTFAELMAQNGAFAALARRQLLED